MLNKRVLLFAILILVFAFIVLVYINNNYKTINEINRFNSADITKISFQYNNPAIKGGKVENKEKIEKFMKYINSCVIVKKHDQTPVAGYYQMAVFFIGDKEVMRLTTYGKFIEIDDTQYEMVMNKLDIKKIDDFINSIK